GIGRTEAKLTGDIGHAAACRAAAERREQTAEQTLSVLRCSLAVSVACRILELVIWQLAEIFRSTLVVGLAIEIAVRGICRNKAIVQLLGFAIIDCVPATESVHEVVNSSWHSQCGFEG